MDVESGQQTNPASKYVKVIDEDYSTLQTPCAELVPQMLGKILGSSNRSSSPVYSSNADSNKSDNSKYTSTPPKELYTKDQKWEKDPVITEECLINLSIFHEAVKKKQYAEAYEPWLEVYTTCPSANRLIYTDGVKILEWKYEHSVSTIEKNKFGEMLIELYDKKIFYFGSNAK